MPGSGAVRQIVAGLEADIRKGRAEVQRLKDENQRLRIQVEGLEADRDAAQDEGKPRVGGEFSEDNPAVPCADLEDEVAGIAGADLGPSPY